MKTTRERTRTAADTFTHSVPFYEHSALGRRTGNEDPPSRLTRSSLSRILTLVYSLRTNERHESQRRGRERERERAAATRAPPSLRPSLTSIDGPDFHRQLKSLHLCKDAAATHSYSMSSERPFSPHSRSQRIRVIMMMPDLLFHLEMRL